MKMTAKILLTMALFGLAAGTARAEKIRTVASILGAEPIHVTGVGLVKGLSGTGDKSEAALKMWRKYLEANNYNLDTKDLSSKNMALVSIDAEIPPFVSVGQRIPIRVTSMGDAASLVGGVLQQTALRFNPPKGPAVVMATGRVLTGGHLTTGMIQNGGQVLMGNPVDVVGPDGAFVIKLKRQSFTDAATIARSINWEPSTNPNLQTRYGFQRADLTDDAMVARAQDAGTVIVTIPPAFRDKQVEYIQEVMNLEVPLSRPARVLFNRQTDTVIITGEVRVDPVAISHRNLSVTLPAVEQGARPRAAAEWRLEAGDERRVVELDGPGQIPNLQNLINTLNAMGVTTADTITIVEKLKAAGALHAELIVE